MSAKFHKIMRAWYYAEMAYHCEDFQNINVVDYGTDRAFWTIGNAGGMVVSVMGTGTQLGGSFREKAMDWFSNINAFDVNLNHIHDGFDKAIKPYVLHMKLEILKKIKRGKISSILFTE